MKVKILQSIASPGYSYAAGQVVDVTKERAAEFVKYGIAEKAKVEPVKETTAAPPAEVVADSPPAAAEKTVKKVTAKKKKGDDVADNN